jgi:hypothetical protein
MPQSAKLCSGAYAAKSWKKQLPQFILSIPPSYQLIAVLAESN